MRLRRTAPLLLACTYLLLAALAVGLVIGRAYARGAYRHVTVRVYNVDSSERVFVNCEQVAWLQPGDDEHTFDLGWLDTDDRVTMAASSTVGDVAWGFHAISNGEEMFLHQKGKANVNGFRAEPDALVMAKTYTAGGDPLGTVGCQGEGMVDAGLTGYRLSRDEIDAPMAPESESPFRRKRSELDVVVAGGGIAPIFIGIAGIAALFLTARPRNFVLRNARRLNPIAAAFSVLGVTSSLFGLWHYLGPDLFFGVFGLVGVLLLAVAAVAVAAPTLSCSS